jgi:hypothetical protein
MIKCTRGAASEHFPQGAASEHCLMRCIRRSSKQIVQFQEEAASKHCHISGNQQVNAQPQRRAAWPWNCLVRIGEHGSSK